MGPLRLWAPWPLGMPLQDLWGGTEQAFRASLGEGKARLGKLGGEGGELPWVWGCLESPSG